VDRKYMNSEKVHRNEPELIT